MPTKFNASIGAATIDPSKGTIKIPLTTANMQVVDFLTHEAKESCQVFIFPAQMRLPGMKEDMEAVIEELERIMHHEYPEPEPDDEGQDDLPGSEDREVVHVGEEVKRALENIFKGNLLDVSKNDYMGSIRAALMIQIQRYKAFDDQPSKIRHDQIVKEVNRLDEEHELTAEEIRQTYSQDVEMGNRAETADADQESEQ